MAKRNGAKRKYYGPARLEAERENNAIKQRIIEGIAAGKPVIQAVQEAGIGWRRSYVWRAEDPRFREAWNRARRQVREREVFTPLPVPATPPIAGRAPRIFVGTFPGHKFSDYDPEIAQPGDKVVCIFWSFNRFRPDRFVTYTVQQKGEPWKMDPQPDRDAYEAVKPPESERPVWTMRRFVFVGAKGTVLRPRGEAPQEGDRFLVMHTDNMNYYKSSPPRPYSTVCPVGEGGTEIPHYSQDKALCYAALAADQSVYGEEV